MVLPQGPRRGVFLMSEVPLYTGPHRIRHFLYVPYTSYMCHILCHIRLTCAIYCLTCAIYGSDLEFAVLDHDAREEDPLERLALCLHLVHRRDHHLFASSTVSIISRTCQKLTNLALNCQLLVVFVA